MMTKGSCHGMALIYFIYSVAQSLQSLLSDLIKKYYVILIL